MIVKLYAIRDKKSEFGTPVPIRDDNGAKRWFDHEIKTNEFMNTYANDFELYHIGQMDTEKGRVIGNELPELIITGEEVNYGNKESDAIPNAG